MEDLKEFNDIAEEIINTEIYQKLKNFIQHGNTTVYEHSYNVALACYLKAKTKKKYDIKSLVRAALLHDFFLYDWHILEGRKRLHGYRHPLISCCNAKKYFNINIKEWSIIRTHMWPLTILHMPKCREGWLVMLVDKKQGLLEVKKAKKLKKENKKKVN